MTNSGGLLTSIAPLPESAENSFIFSVNKDRAAVTWPSIPISMPMQNRQKPKAARGIRMPTRYTTGILAAKEVREKELKQ